MQIIIAENDAELCQHLAQACVQKGYQVRTFESGDTIGDSCKAQRPDLILLDDQMPGCRGQDVLAHIRKDGHDCPVLFISGNADRENILTAFRNGADDYIVKPFDTDVLIEKMNAVLRRQRVHVEGRASKSRKSIETSQGFFIDDSLHKVFVGEQDLGLTQTEFKIFRSLIDSGGGVIARHNLAESVLGTLNVTIRAIDVHVCTMRKKLGRLGRMVETVRGIGYRFRC